MFNTVLVPLNLKENQSRLERMSSFLAQFGSQNLILLHVFAGPAGNPRAEERLRRAGNIFAQDGHRWQSCLRSGSIAAVTASEAERSDCDLIAFPWRYKSWIQRSLTGSTTKDIVRLAERPVLVFKNRIASVASDKFTVLYATAFQETDRFVIPYLKSHVPADGQVFLLNVSPRAPDPDTEERRLQRTEADLQRLAEECRESIPEVETLAAIGGPRKIITRQANRQKADLLIIGKADTDKSLFNMLGSVAEAVAYEARCSVLIFPREYQTKEQ